MRYMETADANPVEKMVGTGLRPQPDVWAARTKIVALAWVPDHVTAALGAPHANIKLGPQKTLSTKLSNSFL